jgi:hypothetical protein
VADIEIVVQPVPLARLMALAEGSFGDLVKAVVDVEKGIMAIGGELHADTRRQCCWLVGLAKPTCGASVCTRPSTARRHGSSSMINVRPAQGNRSQGVGDSATRERIAQIVDRLVAAAP